MNIKEIRERSGLTQAAFGEKLGVSAGTIAQYENGKRKPGEKVLKKIYAMFGVAYTEPEAVKIADKREPRRAVEDKRPAAAKITDKREPRAAITDARGPRILIQSPLGGVITPEEIASRVGDADDVYVRVDENKAYWVKGEETGSVDLW